MNRVQRAYRHLGVAALDDLIGTLQNKAIDWYEFNRTARNISLQLPPSYLPTPCVNGTFTQLTEERRTALRQGKFGTPNVSLAMNLLGVEETIGFANASLTNTALSKFIDQSRSSRSNLTRDSEGV